MSLQALALAICATGALAETLPEWVTVAMEPHDPLELAEGQERPVVAVFVGDERTDIDGRSWTNSDTTIELVVQIVLPRFVAAQTEGVTCRFDTGRGGTRPIYAFVHEALRRVFNAPSAGPWATLLQDLFTGHPHPVTGMLGRADRPGKLPVPILDYSIPCEVIEPPTFGEPPQYPWPDIVEAMRADPAFTPADADFFEALLEGRPLKAWEAEIALLGLTVRGAAALGLGPVAGVDETPPAVELALDAPHGQRAEVDAP